MLLGLYHSLVYEQKIKRFSISETGWHLRSVEGCRFRATRYKQVLRSTIYILNGSASFERHEFHTDGLGYFQHLARRREAAGLRVDAKHDNVV
jgi:hypothetical protein